MSNLAREVIANVNLTATVARMIDEECDALKAMLREKNAAYGNSALDPVRIFSRADADEQIRVRIDDKLSRLSHGAAAGEDVVRDLMGYLVLLRVAERMRREREATQAAINMGAPVIVGTIPPVPSFKHPSEAF